MTPELFAVLAERLGFPALLILCGGYAVWRIITSTAAWMMPRVDRLITATEEHTAILTRMEQHQSSATTLVYGQHQRIEDFAREARDHARNTEELCERILLQLAKEAA